MFLSSASPVVSAYRRMVAASASFMTISMIRPTWSWVRVRPPATTGRASRVSSSSSVCAVPKPDCRHQEGLSVPAAMAASWPGSIFVPGRYLDAFSLLIRVMVWRFSYWTVICAEPVTSSPGPYSNRPRGRPAARRSAGADGAMMM